MRASRVELLSWRATTACKIQDRQDHFVATKIAEDDEARVNDPRQTDEPDVRGGARAPDDAPPATPSSQDQKTRFFDIGAHSPDAPGDDDMQDVEATWAVGPAGKGDGRVLSPDRRPLGVHMTQRFQ